MVARFERMSASERVSCTRCAAMDVWLYRVAELVEVIGQLVYAKDKVAY